MNFNSKTANYIVNAFNGIGNPHASSGTGRIQESVGEVQSRFDTYAATLEGQYGKYTVGLEDGWKKTISIIAMENANIANRAIMEATNTSSIVNFEKFAYPLIRQIIPNMAATELVSIQPMFGPVSQIFYFNYVYGTTRGKVSAGQSLYENLDSNYGSNRIESEFVDSGDGNATQFTGTLSYTPIKPGTLTIDVDGLVVQDDASGNLIGDVGVGTNTIDYTSGAYDVTFIVAPGSGAEILVTHDVDLEGSDQVPDIDLVLTSVPVFAREHKLRAKWSMESAYSLNSQFGLSAQAELLNALASEIRYEIDNNIVRNIERIAYNAGEEISPGVYREPDTIWDRTAPANANFQEHKQELIDTFIAGSNLILTRSGRAIGTWIVAGTKVVNVIRGLSPRFQPQPHPATRGIFKIGVLDSVYNIFHDTRLPENQWLMGFLGNEFLHAGFVWSPWIVGFTTPVTYLDDFLGRQGLGSLYGQKPVNAKFYIKSQIIKS